jgi:hypothetical protein
MDTPHWITTLGLFFTYPVLILAMSLIACAAFAFASFLRGHWAKDTINGLENTIRAVEHRLESDVKGLENTIRAQQERLELAREQYADVQSKRAALEGRVSGQETEIAELRGSLSPPAQIEHMARSNNEIRQALLGLANSTTRLGHTLTAGEFATFNLADEAVASVQDTTIVGPPPRNFVMARGNASFEMQGGLLVNRDAPSQFRSPTGEFSDLSNDELRNKESEISEALRALHCEISSEQESILTTQSTCELAKNLDELSERAKLEFRVTFQEKSASLASEMINRIGTIEIPPTPTVAPKEPFAMRTFLEEKKRVQRIQRGMWMLLYRTFAGPDPVPGVSQFLDFVTEKLPR